MTWTIIVELDKRYVEYRHMWHLGIFYVKSRLSQTTQLAKNKDMAHMGVFLQFIWRQILTDWQLQTIPNLQFRITTWHYFKQLVNRIKIFVIQCNDNSDIRNGQIAMTKWNDNHIWQIASRLFRKKDKRCELFTTYD